MIEGVLIVIAALSIFRHAWETWQDPHRLAMPLQGIALNAVATVLNAVWSAVLIRTGRRLRSPALIADGRHLLADVVTSVGIAIGVGLVVQTGYLLLDPILAAATGVYVLWSGMAMISISVGGLMDAAPEPAVINRIRELVAESAAGAIEAHDLRTACWQGDVSRVSPRCAGHYDSRRVARDLRPHRGDAAGRNGAVGDHHPCRARSRGEAARCAGAVNP